MHSTIGGPIYALGCYNKTMVKNKSVSNLEYFKNSFRPAIFAALGLVVIPFIVFIGSKIIYSIAPGKFCGGWDSLGCAFIGYPIIIVLSIVLAVVLLKRLLIQNWKETFSVAAVAVLIFILLLQLGVPIETRFSSSEFVNFTAFLFVIFLTLFVSLQTALLLLRKRS